LQVQSRLPSAEMSEILSGIQKTRKERKHTTMPKYILTLQVESDTNPKDWYLGDTLIIDDEYQLLDVKEVSNA
jgi:hypothetical protein